MRFFLDTADPEEARRVREWGLLDGILLRPESAEMKGRDARRVLADLAQVGDGPVVATLAAGDPKAMYKEARELHKHGARGLDLTSTADRCDPLVDNSLLPRESFCGVAILAPPHGPRRDVGKRD